MALSEVSPHINDPLYIPRSTTRLEQYHMEEIGKRSDCNGHTVNSPACQESQPEAKAVAVK